jgi:hypothetical protein
MKNEGNWKGNTILLKGTTRLVFSRFRVAYLERAYRRALAAFTPALLCTQAGGQGAALLKMFGLTGWYIDPLSALRRFQETPGRLKHCY